MQHSEIAGMDSQVKAFLTSNHTLREYRLSPILNGGNNRSWKLLAPGHTYFLKQYFTSDTDKRDRFGTELMFCLLMKKLNITCVPEVIAADRSCGLTLFSYIPGKRPLKTQINELLIEQALNFLGELNSNRAGIWSQCLPLASDACFTIEAQILSVQSRLDRLYGIEVKDREDRDAINFIKKKLRIYWQAILRRIEGKIRHRDPAVKEPVDPSNRVISPSDFGFHNTLLSIKQDLVFVDFEYAGWDDAAKLACDFFSQPEIPVPLEYFSFFSQKLQTLIGAGDDLRLRIELLFPLCRVKWCCIMLNDFLSCEKKRKDFAFFEKDRRKEQLEKTVLYFEETQNGLY